MAQGTGDKRFLVKPVKATSVEVLLALVVSALALAGCGGGSSDSSSSESSGAGSASAETTGTSASNAAAGEAGGGASAAAEATGGGGGAAGQGNAPSGGGGKHGPRVPQPKGAPEPGITPQQKEEATVADMVLQSPSVQASAAGPPAMSALYTCDGKNLSPALQWQGVPSGTAELALFAMNIQPVEEKLFFDWAVAGLSPDLKEIDAGKLPKDAVVGRNSFGETGYKICPAGEGETYMFALFAVPKKLSPGRGFEPLDLRKEVLDASGNVGLMAVSYS